MPLYEYECKKCHHRFEKIQKFSDPHVKKCPKCGGPIEQVISAPAVQFKGSGWYVTDYAKKSSSAFFLLRILRTAILLRKKKTNPNRRTPRSRKALREADSSKIREFEEVGRFVQEEREEDRLVLHFVGKHLKG